MFSIALDLLLFSLFASAKMNSEVERSPTGCFAVQAAWMHAGNSLRTARSDCPYLFSISALFFSVKMYVPSEFIALLQLMVYPSSEPPRDIKKRLFERVCAEMSGVSDVVMAIIERKLVRNWANNDSNVSNQSNIYSKTFNFCRYSTILRYFIYWSQLWFSSFLAHHRSQLLPRPPVHLRVLHRRSARCILNLMIIYLFYICRHSGGVQTTRHVRLPVRCRYQDTRRRVQKCKYLSLKISKNQYFRFNLFLYLILNFVYFHLIIWYF